MNVFEYMHKVVLENPGTVLVKWTASWCKPCQSIAMELNSYIQSLMELSNNNNNISVIELDIDENTQMYAEMKKRKLLRGVPALFVYYVKTDDDKNKIIINSSNNELLQSFLTPDDLVLGADLSAIAALFERIKQKK